MMGRLVGLSRDIYRLLSEPYIEIPVFVQGTETRRIMHQLASLIFAQRRDS